MKFFNFISVTKIRASAAWYVLPLLVGSLFYSSLASADTCPAISEEQYAAVRDAVAPISMHRRTRRDMVGFAAQMDGEQTPNTRHNRILNRFFVRFNRAGVAGDAGDLSNLVGLLSRSEVLRVWRSLNATARYSNEARRRLRPAIRALAVIRTAWRPASRGCEPVPFNSTVVAEPETPPAPQVAAPTPPAPEPTLQLDPACQTHISQARAANGRPGSHLSIDGSDPGDIGIMASILQGVTSGSQFAGLTGRIRCELREVDGATELVLHVEEPDVGTPATVDSAASTSDPVPPPPPPAIPAAPPRRTAQTAQ